MKYRKRPVVIEAKRWDGTPEGAIPLVDWINAEGDCPATFHASTGIHIKTLEGTVNASPGDWIIQGVKGEFYPCKHDIFETTYEEVTDED